MCVCERERERERESAGGFESEQWPFPKIRSTYKEKQNMYTRVEKELYTRVEKELHVHL